MSFISSGLCNFIVFVGARLQFCAGIPAASKVLE